MGNHILFYANRTVLFQQGRLFFVKWKFPDGVRKVGFEKDFPSMAKNKNKNKYNYSLATLTVLVIFRCSIRTFR